MSTNKQAIIRYQALDKCFSNFGRKFYIEDLIEACNNALYNFSGIENGVKRRQIYDDINFMESDEGWAIPLEKNKDGRRVYFRYSDSHFSINSQPLSQTEIEQLKSTIFMLNRFKGLPQFEWMDEVLTRFEDTFGLNDNIVNVVGFEQNPYLKGLNYFTELFNAIVNRQVLQISYNKSFKEKQVYIVHPYYLKQYNNRWFLFGHCPEFSERSKIINIALDRIENCKTLNLKYIDNNSIDFNEYFEDVVGVTVLNKPVEIIRLKVDISKYNYIKTKPIHPSQKVIEKNKDYVIIELNLIPNYEFETLLLGFADSIKIIEPKYLKEHIKNRVKEILKKNK